MQPWDVYPDRIVELNILMELKEDMFLSWRKQLFKDLNKSFQFTNFD